MVLVIPEGMYNVTHSALSAPSAVALYRYVAPRYATLKEKVDPVQHSPIDPFTFVSRMPRFVEIVLDVQRLTGVVSSTLTGTELIGLCVELFLMMRNSGADSSWAQVADATFGDG